jgi:hypothetical protein
MNTITKVEAAWCFVGIDETRHWNIPFILAPHLERILTIYLVNRAEVTHAELLVSRRGL